ncbi:Gar1/Naf1 RNA binding region-domain-containing protein [Echria macrotheca]|uniref:H/ACA ribonucleoprotein complex non-core subunit NAF1 n=1 Tax=Echria macrotheca TaxID=438768 RepID=A0AAJ0F2G2_9PEZI|nr:Gar1/Naf1 RNA binding region-domain-containing protein [Echria macrotheca]
MSDQPFQIPGLGYAKPNEKLPVHNFTPESLGASAVPGLANPSAGDVTTDQMASGPTEKTDVDKDRSTAEVEVAKTNASSSQDHPHVQVAHSEEQEDVVMDTGSSSSKEAPGLSATTALETTLGDTIMEEANGSEDEAPEGDDEHPEWEVDSSPYVSSSESESSSSDSDDDEDYQPLGLEDTERVLMVGAYSNDEKTELGKFGAPLRTKNEQLEDVLPKPDVTITAEMDILPLGEIHSIVEKTVVIKSFANCEEKVLERGSVLCKGDRTVIGALTDMFGSIQRPMFIVRYATDEEIQELGLEIGATVHYSVQHAVYELTRVAKENKGTDASNVNDEEVPPAEQDFSDDEKEQAFKKEKRRPQALHEGRGGQGGQQRRGRAHLPRSANTPSANVHLNYDEEEDGPYKPLSRPPTLAQGTPTTHYSSPQAERGYSHGRRPSLGGQRDRGGHRGGHRQSSRGGGRPSTHLQNSPPPLQDFERPSTRPASASADFTFTHPPAPNMAGPPSQPPPIPGFGGLPWFPPQGQPTAANSSGSAASAAGHTVGLRTRASNLPHSRLNHRRHSIRRISSMGFNKGEVGTSHSIAASLAAIPSPEEQKGRMRRSGGRADSAGEP